MRGPLGESHDVPCIPRGLRDGTDSRDGATPSPMTSLASLGDLGMGRTVGTELPLVP